MIEDFILNAGDYILTCDSNLFYIRCSHSDAAETAVILYVTSVGTPK